MDLVGAFSDEEFECLISKMFTKDADDELMSQLQNVPGDMFSNYHNGDNNNLLPSGIEISAPSFFPYYNEAIVNNNNDIALSLFPNYELSHNYCSYISHQESINSSRSDDQVIMHFHQDHHEFPFLLETTDYNISDEPAVDCCVNMDNIINNEEGISIMVPAFSNDASQDSNLIIDVDNGVDVKENIIKRKSDETIILNDEKPKKKARVPKKKNGGQTKKNKKVVLEDNNYNISTTDNNEYEKESDGGQEMIMKSPTSSTMLSEDEYTINSASLEGSNGGETSKESLLTPISKGKSSRASRGNATDPQSLYARKRRERINERLRILQKLIPNGTKVDISTMLEEAVQYVNFLQLQIKLLSSDDMWMYAPLAYNGIDVGVYQKMFPNM